MLRFRVPFLTLLFLLPLWSSLSIAAPFEPAVELLFFYADNCPHCAEAEPVLEDLEKRYPTLVIRRYQVWNNRDNFELMVALARAFGSDTVSTPTIAVSEQIWFGFSMATAAEIETTVKSCLTEGCRSPLERLQQPKPPVDTVAPIETVLGRIDIEETSLPALTLILGLLDSFNPCAFFVLLFLLSLLVHARSRSAMFLIGGTFVLFSGVIYFLFMAAWLNLFLLAGHLRQLTLAAGMVALVIAGLNIKDYFLFRRGPSLSIPEAAKPRLFARMRRLVQQQRLPPVLLGTVVLAVAANSYELLCTAGFPMIYTRALTLKDLSLGQYYGYLALYNLIYVIPLAVIVVLFAVTLGSRKLQENEGRVLKLLSGLMMLGLGLILVIAPDLMHQLPALLALLGGAVLGTALLVRLFPPGR